MMKSVKFKNMNNKKKNTITVVCIFSLLLLFILVTLMTKSVSSNLNDYLKLKVKKENTLLLKNAFVNLKNYDFDTNNFLKVITNSKEEIVEVEFNIKECTKLLSTITGYLNENLSEYNYLGYRLDIPIGFMSNNLFLKNLGPKIPIKVEIGDIALGNVLTNVKGFGINSALIEMYVKITLRTMIIYPFDALEYDSVYESLIASKVITGSVPSLYSGTLNNSTSNIDIPINN